MGDTNKRSVVKAISFRVIATLLTIFLVIMFTGSLVIAGIVGAFDFVSKLVAYYAHERVWERVSWGRSN